VNGVYIITTVYNEEFTIAELIRSIAYWREKGRFGRKLIKWVVVDDGSTDKSFEIIKGLMRENPFIKLLVLRKNSGKGWAFRQGAEWAAKQDPGIQDRVIVQVDSDISGLRPRDIDWLIEMLAQPGKSRRVAALALVPSPHKWGLRKWLRESLARVTARERIAITGQRAYFGSTLVAVLPLLTRDTGFGLEPLLNAEIIAESKRLQSRHKLNEQERHGLIAVTKWVHVSHLSYMEKVWSSSTNPFRRIKVFNAFLTFFYGCGHYIRIFFDCIFGVLRGLLEVKKRWKSRRQSRKGKA
jgi:glycosyltransferase involved in cell wall biosynthesis